VDEVLSCRLAGRSGVAGVLLGGPRVWMEMLCVMHNAEQYGHLLLNGRPMTDAQLAMLAGTTPDQIPVLLGELEHFSIRLHGRKRAPI
jgi:hypothetical protein